MDKDTREYKKSLQEIIQMSNLDHCRLCGMKPEAVDKIHDEGVQAELERILEKIESMYLEYAEDKPDDFYEGHNRAIDKMREELVKKLNR